MSLRIVSGVYFSRVEIMIFATAGASLVDFKYFLGSMKARKYPWFLFVCLFVVLSSVLSSMTATSHRWLFKF